MKMAEHMMKIQWCHSQEGATNVTKEKFVTVHRYLGNDIRMIFIDTIHPKSPHYKFWVILSTVPIKFGTHVDHRKY